MLRRCPGRPATWSDAVEVFTPLTLRDLYLTLSRDDRRHFLKLIAPYCTGLEPLILVSELTPSQKWDFNNRVFSAVVETCLPVLISEARKIVSEDSRLDDAEFDKQLKAKVSEFVLEAAAKVSALEKEKLKEARDPKPRKTDRDDEIVRLRDIEEKTFGEIGPALVRKNPKWCGKSGKPLTRDAVEKAYYRRKGMPTN